MRLHFGVIGVTVVIIVTPADSVTRAVIVFWGGVAYHMTNSSVVDRETTVNLLISCERRGSRQIEQAVKNKHRQRGRLGRISPAKDSHHEVPYESEWHRDVACVIRHRRRP